MKIVRMLLIFVGLAMVLFVTNQSIRSYQGIVDSGKQVLLELRPVDPRSLIQGDYMFLRYAENVFPPGESAEKLPRGGTLVLRLDEHGTGTYARMEDGSPLAADEVRLRFKSMTMWGDPGIGAETFNFEEGQAEIYADAKYGVLRIDESGKSVLVGLADEQRVLIEP